MPSLRTLGERMHLAFNQVGELLRGERLPVDEEQARALLAALGATDPESGRGVRLYRAARAEQDQAKRDTGQPGWWLRSNYVELVHESAPRQLLDREAELAELADWCVSGDEAYVRWEAGPGAGKSALMYWLVLNPPPGTWVISFFVTARLAAQSDSTAFTDALLDQLAAVTGEQVPPSTPAAVRDGLRRRLLEKAAAQAVKAGRRLVLVVDGLDEDSGSLPGSGLPSVAACLPKRFPDGLRVIVAGRPDPPLPADVDPDHPLHSCTVRLLGASPYAADAMRRAQRELDEVLAADRHRNDGLGYEVLGLVTAAGGGLGDRDLQQLTGCPAFEIDRLLGGVFGRTIASRPAPHAAARVFLFTHETLREQATERLGPDILDGFAGRLHAWADGYRQRRWPSDTPGYLLRGYPRMLADAGDADRLAALAANPVRHHRMLAATGGDAAALAEITAAHALISTSASPDLLAALRLAWHRGQLDRRNAHIPFELPAVWATLGQPVRAEALARSIPSDHHQALALAGVAMAAAGAGDYDRARELADRAEQIARSFTDAGWRMRVLAAAAAGVGDYDRAEQIARSTAIYMSDRPEILVTVAAAAARAGDYDRARELAGRAERAARSITPLDLQALPLAEAAMAAAGAGDYDRARQLADPAEQIARSITNPTWRARNLAAAAAAAGDGDYDRAEQIARSADPREQARVLAEVAMAAAGVGDRDRARQLADRAEQIARSITDPDDQARALATAVALVGDYDRAEQIAQFITHPHEQARPLAEVAMAAAGAGDCDRARELADRAEQIARSITDRAKREDILARVATVVALVGDCDHAEQIARSITHPDEQAGTLAAVATAAARAGDYDRAERIARSITDPDKQARALAEVAARPATTTALSGSPGPSPTRTRRGSSPRWPRRRPGPATTTAPSGSPGPSPTRTSRRGLSPRWRPGPATTTALSGSPGPSPTRTRRRLPWPGWRAALPSRPGSGLGLRAPWPPGRGGFRWRHSPVPIRRPYPPSPVAWQQPRTWRRLPDNGRLSGTSAGERFDGCAWRGTSIRRPARPHVRCQQRRLHEYVARKHKRTTTLGMDIGCYPERTSSRARQPDIRCITPTRRGWKRCRLRQ